MRPNSPLRALAGCATMSMQAQIRSTAERLPVADRLPQRIGLLISGPTLDYKFHARIPMGEWVYPFGKNLPEVCRQTFLQVFESVTLVQSRDHHAFDLIIEPQFDEETTRVEMSFSKIHTFVGMRFDASEASGTKWSKNVVGDIITGGKMTEMESHGQAVSKAVAVAAAALAMRADLAAASGVDASEAKATRRYSSFRDDFYTTLVSESKGKVAATAASAWSIRRRCRTGWKATSRDGSSGGSTHRPLFKTYRRSSPRRTRPASS